eukprot:g11989.t1
MLISDLMRIAAMLLIIILNQMNCIYFSTGVGYFSINESLPNVADLSRKIRFHTVTNSIHARADLTSKDHGLQA